MKVLHQGIKSNIILNDLIIETIAEDSKFKEEEMRTFTIQKMSLPKEELNKPECPRDKALRQCSYLSKFEF